MEWSEIENFIRREAQAQPRGFKAKLAQQVGVKPPTISQSLTGKDPKPIPTAWAEKALNLMGYSMEIVPQKSAEK